MKKMKYILFAVIIVGVLWFLAPTIKDLADSQTIPCEEKLYTALVEEQETIVLAGYGLSEAELQELWSSTFYSHSDLFHVSDQYEYSMMNDLVLSVTPRYSLTGWAADTLGSDYEKELDSILSTVDPGWTDLQKALYLHDYLCTRYCYDVSYTKFSAPDLLLDGTGVCQAYTFVYSDLLNRVGIPCSYLLSSAQNHTWNIVTLDGTQYHVDVTHDDPLSDRLGYASHKHFLISDSALPPNNGLTTEEGLGQCTDSSYDDAFWQNATSAFVPLNDRFYFIKDGSIHAWDGKSVTQIFPIRSTWFTGVGDGSYWKGNYSALWRCEDSLLYNTSSAIMALNPKTGETKTVYTHSGSGSIFGFSYLDDQLTLQITTGPNDPGEYLTITDFTV